MPGRRRDHARPGLHRRARDRARWASSLTHAHEDHIGAIPYLWPRLRCPIYATPFTASLLRAKLLEAGLLEHEVPITEVPLSRQVHDRPVRARADHPDPFDPRAQRRGASARRSARSCIPATGSSIPIRWSAPITDEAALRRLGDEGVLAMVCDSTNALRAGRVGLRGRGARVARSSSSAATTSRVAVACFASNVARLDIDRRGGAARMTAHVALVGRSLWRIDKAARETGYLAGPAALPHRGRGRLSAARQGAADLHRQPGRAARGAWRASPTTSIRTSRSRRATP